MKDVVSMAVKKEIPETKGKFYIYQKHKKKRKKKARQKLNYIVLSFLLL